MSIVSFSDLFIGKNINDSGSILAKLNKTMQTKEHAPKKNLIFK